MLTYAETHCLDCDRRNADCVCGFGRVGKTYPAGSVPVVADSGPVQEPKKSWIPDWVFKLFGALAVVYVVYLFCKAI